MPTRLMVFAKQRAAAEQRSFSNYIAALIAKDVEQGRLKK